MRNALRFVRWLSLTVILLGLVIPLLMSWMTESLSIGVVASWFHGRLVAWANLANANPHSFQLLTILLLGAPTSLALALLGGAAFLWERMLANSGASAEVVRLEDDLERFLLAFNEDYDFVGRLRRLVGRFDTYKFMEFRRLVFQAVYEYCGKPIEGKETFIVTPTVIDEGKALISVVNEKVNEAIVANLPSIGACQLAMTTGRSQLVKAVAHNQSQIMTPSGWLLPQCQSLLVCPIYVLNEPRGVIGVYHRDPNAFTHDDDQIFLEHMASILSLAYTIRAREVSE